MKYKLKALRNARLLLSKELSYMWLMVIMLVLGFDGNAMAASYKYGKLKSLHTSKLANYRSEVITGTVKDAKGGVLPGVSVSIKGTRTGTQTDLNGKFSLSVPDANSTLVFSLVGFTSQEIKIGSDKSIHVTLKESSTDLSEVVVIGYGEAKKATLTGSISTVQGKDIAKSPAPNVASSLEGRLPGLVVNQRSGEPGRDDPGILIRGTGTDGDASPLIIIDGVQRSGIGRLNPGDIESISVLKDASAAIYGARAANGVILVTTKRGSKGKPVFDFTYNYGFQSATKIPQVLDAATFATVYNEGDFYDKGRPTTGYVPFYSPDAITKFANGSDPINYPNTNWVKQAIKPSAGQQRYNMQVSGGSDNIHYFLSFGSQSQDGFFVNNPTHYKQYNFRTKVDVDINKYLNIGANLSANLSNGYYPSSGAGTTNVNFINILQGNPTIIARYPNGLIGSGRLGQNPLLMDQRGLDQINNYPLFSTFTATLKIPGIEGLKLDGSFNYDLANSFESDFSLPYSYYQYNVLTGNYDKTAATGTQTISLNNIYNRNYTILYNYRLTYDHNFGLHHMGAMIGSEQQQNYGQNFTAYRKNFISSSIAQLNEGSSAAADKDNSGYGTSSAYNNYLGRFNYDFASKYLFEFVFRYDGSPTFPVGNRYGFFPGFSGGWRLSEEKFIKDNFKFIDQLKVRASYGETGNDRVGQYQYLQNYGFGQNYVFGTSDASSIYALTAPNPNITWERSKKTDFGLEASMWNGLLGLDLTVFNENRNNLLQTPSGSTSHVFGFTALPNQNIGKINNHGFEFIVNHRNSIGALKYSISASLSYNRSKVIYVDETPQLEPYQGRTGFPVGSFEIYKADGIFHTQAELNAYPHAAGTQVGDIKILDLNHDGKIDANDEFTFDGSQIPKYVYGLNTNFAYKGFDLNVFIQGQAGAYGYDSNLQNLGTTDFANAITARAANHWTPSNPNGTMPRARAYQPGNNTFFLFDDSFARLKTLELGYTIPGKVLARLRASNLRLFVSAYNLFTYSKTVKWADPELDYNNGGTNTYPPLRVINMGATLTF